MTVHTPQMTLHGRTSRFLRSFEIREQLARSCRHFSKCLCCSFQIKAFIDVFFYNTFISDRSSNTLIPGILLTSSVTSSSSLSSRYSANKEVWKSMTGLGFHRRISVLAAALPCQKLHNISSNTVGRLMTDEWWGIEITCYAGNFLWSSVLTGRLSGFSSGKVLLFLFHILLLQYECHHVWTAVFQLWLSPLKKDRPNLRLVCLKP